MVPNDEQLYAVQLRVSTGFGRRVIFSGPGGSGGAEAIRQVSGRAGRMRVEFDNLGDAQQALRAYAAEFYLRGVAR